MVTISVIGKIMTAVSAIAFATTKLAPSSISSWKTIILLNPLPIPALPISYTAALPLLTSTALLRRAIRTPATFSYATAYHNALALPGGTLVSIHPSEPNYLWQEAGSNLGIFNDNDPYGPGGAVAAIAAYLASNPTVSGQNLSGLLQAAGIPWKTYQEDTNLLNTAGGNFNQGGTITNTPITDPSQLTVPLVSFSGTAATPPAGATYQQYTNAYNGSHQYNFACKHDGTLFFLDTNGGDDPTTGNVEAKYYRPLQQLQDDLDHDTVARYNLITPNQYNDMHSTLNAPFVYHGVSYTGDLSNIAQGDNFLSMILPKIMASKAYKRNGVIVIWNDETEGTNQNDFTHTSPCLTLFSSEASLSRGKDRQFLKILVTNKCWIFLVILPCSIDLDLIVRRFALHSDRDRSCIYARSEPKAPTDRTRIHPFGGGLLGERQFQTARHCQFWTQGPPCAAS